MAVKLNFEVAVIKLETWKHICLELEHRWGWGGGGGSLGVWFICSIGFSYFCDFFFTQNKAGSGGRGAVLDLPLQTIQASIFIQVLSLLLSGGPFDV